MHVGKDSAKETVSGPGHRSWSEESRIEHQEIKDGLMAHASCFMLHASRSRSTLNADACLLMLVMLADSTSVVVRCRPASFVLPRPCRGLTTQALDEALKP